MVKKNIFKINHNYIIFVYCGKDFNFWNKTEFHQIEFEWMYFKKLNFFKEFETIILKKIEIVKIKCWKLFLQKLMKFFVEMEIELKTKILWKYNLKIKVFWVEFLKLNLGNKIYKKNLENYYFGKQITNFSIYNIYYWIKFWLF